MSLEGKYRIATPVLITRQPMRKEKGVDLCQPGSADPKPAQNPCLYRKGKEVAIYLTDKKQLCAEVGMVDERHRMSCMVTFSQPDLIIKNVQCRMEKYPHADCPKAESSLEAMIGKSVKPGVVQAVAKSIRDSSCTHLLELFHQACYSVIQARGLYGRQILRAIESRFEHRADRQNCHDTNAAITRLLRRIQARERLRQEAGKRTLSFGP